MRNQNKVRRQRWLSVKWRDRLLAGSLWSTILYLNTHLIHEFPLPTFIQPALDPQFRLQPWVLYSVLLVLLVLWIRLRIFWFVFYFWMFPFVLPFLILRGVLSPVLKLAGWQVLLLLVWSVADTATRMTGTWHRTGILAVAMLPSCYLLVLITSNKYLLVAAAIALLFMSAWILWGTFKWALSPLETFTWLVERTLFYSRKGVEDETFNIDASADEGNEKFKKAQEKIKTERGLLKAVRRARSIIVTEKNLLTMFLFVLLGAVVLTSLNFGFLYYDLHKINPKYFTGTEEEAALIDFWYFSFTVLTTTSDLSPIKPAVRVVRLMTLLELVCSLLLLSLLILVFTTISRHNLEKANSSLNDLVATHEQELGRWEELLRKRPLSLPGNS